MNSTLVLYTQMLMFDSLQPDEFYLECRHLETENICLSLNNHPE